MKAQSMLKILLNLIVISGGLILCKRFPLQQNSASKLSFGRNRKTNLLKRSNLKDLKFLWFLENSLMK